MRRNVNLSELIPMRDRPRCECGLAQILENGAFDGRVYSRATSSDATDKHSGMFTEPSEEAKVMAMKSAPTEFSITHDLLLLARKSAQRYIETIRDRRVAPSDKDVAVLSQLHEPFPNSSSDPREVLKTLDEIGSPATVATTRGRYFGLVTR